MSCVAACTPEQNAIIQAARHGIRIEGAEMYCTTFPCVICIKMIINAGLTKVYYLEGYGDEISQQMIAEASFPVIQLRNTDAPAATSRLPILPAH